MRNIQIIVLFIFVLIKPNFGLSNNTDLKFEHISTLDGLSQSEVYSIYHDNNGFIWIGTLDGLNRYDGYNLIQYKTNQKDTTSISNNTIKSIYEDSYGNLWVGTNNGLNLYDKETDSFKRYLYSNSLVNNSSATVVNNVIERKNGDLLVGTRYGLYFLQHEDLSESEIGFRMCFNQTVHYVIEDANGFIWIASWGVIHKTKFNNAGMLETTLTISSDMLFKNAPPSKIHTLYQDKDGDFWIGTDNGLLMIQSSELQRKDPVIIRSVLGKDHFLNQCRVFCIGEDSSGQLIFGTGNHGVSFFNKKMGEIHTYTVNKSDKYSINNNHVKCFFEDASGVLWLGTLGGGCNKTDLNRKEFQNIVIQHDEGKVQSNVIRSIYEDKKEKLWIGTLNGGFFTYIPSQNKFSKFPATEDNLGMKQIYTSNAIYGSTVYSIKEMHTGALWLGTNKGINVLDYSINTIQHYLADFTKPDSLLSNTVHSIETDDDGLIWIGTGSGLNCFIPAKGNQKSRFVRYRSEDDPENSLSDNVVRFIYNDPINSDMWAGTMNGGLNRIIKQTDGSLQFVRYMHNKHDEKSLSGNYVHMIYRANNGVLWVCTQEGLHKMVEDVENNKAGFIKYSEANGLNGSNVKSILEDENENLWLGTNKGISRFTPATEQFVNFDLSDGILNNEYVEHACFKNEKGKMYFGGVNGITAFFPDRIKLNKQPARALFTKLIVENKEVPVGKLEDGRTLLEKPLWDTDAIELSHKDRFFFIEFASNHYASPQSNQYAYSIEGISQEWIYTDAQNRRVNFTNVKSGDYTLKVKASNNDGLWQENPSILKIKIRPPIWRTLPAYLIYLTILVLIIYYIIREIKLREKLKTEVALKNLEMKKADELNDMKIRFFTNVSHEFRTPLTLIITPLKDIINKLKGHDKIQEQLGDMYKSSQYLLGLTRELTEFRKTEKDALKVKAGRNKMNCFIADIYSSFKVVSKEKNIKYSFINSMEDTEVWFDKGLMSKVFNNLLFNAFKFTPKDGEIVIKTEIGKVSDLEYSYGHSITIGEGNDNTQHVFIRIIDTGIGISSQSLEKIFDRFYQVGSSDSKEHLGSGIGLALAKNLVLLNKGKLIVSSERGKGTEFIVCLPMGDNHFSADEKLTDETDQRSVFLTSEPAEHAENLLDQSPANGIKKHPEQQGLETVLIVEDNGELRKFLKNSLAPEYHILEAINGLDGLNIAIDTMPDLIISDILMPKMDGIELCAKLKENILTSHIPVILLTALSSVQDQIKGLETGADDYIAKPFDNEILKIRIKNLLETRRKLKIRFQNDLGINTDDIASNSKDKEFLDRVVSIIMDRLSDPDFNVNELSTTVLMSRTHVRRKLKALTDQTTVDFIRTIRLKESISLLKTNKYSVAEVSYMTGFGTPSYFTSMFKKQYNVTPMEFLKKTEAKKSV